MKHCNIREMKSNELNFYKQFLAVGLLEDAENFRLTPTDDLHAPFPTGDKEDSFTLGAFVDDELAGVVSFERDGKDREKLRHKGILFRMYVSKDFRGQGVGQALILAVIERVRQIGTIEQINLTVIANNANAKKLYEKFGFKTFSSEEHAIKWKGKYFTEDQMALRL
ncbi:alanine acetyltransferase [Segetibacter aerophilus]|uniref:Alanine acetyltransferase n=2 Tax=Segetibacter aerophilus TaxID=670293 RepID=A0A512BHN0_9BACT|nr:alanine acetyltransferase [Segetibacter aerophilus]